MRGFRSKMLHMDGEFESLHSDLAELGISLNTVPRSSEMTVSGNTLDRASEHRLASSKQKGEKVQQQPEQCNNETVEMQQHR